MILRFGDGIVNIMKDGILIGNGKRAGQFYELSIRYPRNAAAIVSTEKMIENFTL